MLSKKVTEVPFHTLLLVKPIEGACVLAYLLTNNFVALSAGDPCEHNLEKFTFEND